MIKVLLAIFCLFNSTLVLSQVFVGLRNTRYVNFGYMYADHWSIKAEQSINSGNLDYQNMRIYLGGQDSLFQNCLFLSASPYGGWGWNRDYYMFGSLFQAKYYVGKYIALEGLYNPHYDSWYDFSNCWMSGCSVKLIDEVGFTLKYSTLPEFRVPEKRVRAGLVFNVLNLNINPECSLIAQNDVRASLKAMRMCIDMRYVFKKNNKDGTK